LSICENCPDATGRIARPQSGSAAERKNADFWPRRQGGAPSAATHRRGGIRIRKRKKINNKALSGNGHWYPK
jgi:hypothetical protein